MGMEAEEAQQTQGVFLDALERIADEADPPGPQVGQAVERIVDAALGIGRQGVHGEIAARGVDPPVIGIFDAGVAAEAFHIPAQGGDLEMGLADHGGDGAVSDAGGNGVDAVIVQQGQHPFGRIGGGDVDIGDGAFQHRIADAAADEAHLGAVGAQRPDHRLGLGRFHPGLRPQLTDGIAGLKPHLLPRACHQRPHGGPRPRKG